MNALPEHIDNGFPPIEQAIASSLLRGDASAALEMGVKSEYFTNHMLRRLVEAVEILVRNGQTAEPVNVAQVLKANAMLSPEINVELFVGDVFCKVATTAPLQDWINTLRQLAGRRKAVALCRKMESEYPELSKNALELCRSFRREFELAERLMTPGVELSPAAQGQYYLDTLAKIQQGRDGGVIVPWGIPGLDNICPLQRGQIFSLVAGSNTGKTRFLLSDLAGTLLRESRDDGAILIFSKENKNRILWDGLVSILTDIPGRRLNTTSALSAEDTAIVHDCVRYLIESKDRFRLFGKGDYKPTASGIFAQVQRFEDETGVKAAKVAVDYLQNHTPDTRSKGRVEELENIVRELADTSADFDAALLIVSQINRDKSRTGRPGKNDIKGTTALENESDYLSFLHNPSPGHGMRTLEFYAEKTRSGVDRWDEKLIFNAETGKIAGIKEEY